MRKPIPRGAGKGIEPVRIAIFTAYVVKERAEGSPDQLGSSVRDPLHGTLQVKLGRNHTRGLVEGVDRTRFIRQRCHRKFDVIVQRSEAFDYLPVSRLVERR